jgi:hypothetical protein
MSKRDVSSVLAPTDTPGKTTVSGVSGSPRRSWATGHENGRLGKDSLRITNEDRTLGKDVNCVLRTRVTRR